MSLFDDLVAAPDISFAFVAALEQQLGNDALLTLGAVRSSIAEVVHDDAARVAAIAFTTESESGLIALVATSAFAAVLENGASDELFLTACTPALDAAARTIAPIVDGNLESGQAHEAELDALADAAGPTTPVVYPILDGTVPVACLLIAAHAATTASDNVSVAAPDRPTTPSHALTGAPLVLADVEMGVTAELGRCRMSVRELLSLTPGTVIDLDRAAGAPVDVLVNGTLIARGEVVVIDEEFGIRISELLQNEAPVL
jgi:flagellar motor switch protein FliN/FliY